MHRPSHPYQMLSRRKFVRDAALSASALALAPAVLAKPRPLVLVWSEGTAPRSVYPHDINQAIADGLVGLRGWDVKTASIDDPDQGIGETDLDRASVLIWWGHLRHGDVRDDRVDGIVQRVKDGRLGFVGTHSAHWSKPFTRLMGTSCSWEAGYIEDGSELKVAVVDRRHPIAHGIDDFVVPHTERYGEPFVTPTPMDLVFDGTYVLPNRTTQRSRQGMTWVVGRGRIFYFQPGHESYPIYFQEEVRRVFRNAVPWCRPRRA